MVGDVTTHKWTIPYSPSARCSPRNLAASRKVRLRYAVESTSKSEPDWLVEPVVRRQIGLLLSPSESKLDGAGQVWYL